MSAADKIEGVVSVVHSETRVQQSPTMASAGPVLLTAGDSYVSPVAKGAAASNVATAAVEVRSVSPSKVADQMSEWKQEIKEILRQIPEADHRRHDLMEYLRSLKTSITDPDVRLNALEYVRATCELVALERDCQGQKTQASKLKRGTDADKNLSMDPAVSIMALRAALHEWKYPKAKSGAYDREVWGDVLAAKVTLPGITGEISIRDVLKEFSSIGNRHNDPAADAQTETALLRLFRVVHAVGHIADDTDKAHEFPAAIVQSGFLELWLVALRDQRCQADVMKDLSRKGLY